MGHAGAIVGGADDTAAAKMKIMRECGIRVVESPATIGIAMKEELQKEMDNWKLPSWGIRCFNFGYDGSTSRDILKLITNNQIPSTPNKLKISIKNVKN